MKRADTSFSKACAAGKRCDANQTDKCIVGQAGRRRKENRHEFD